MKSDHLSILDDVFLALNADSLDLPVLPDMALKVRNLIDDPESSTGQFVKLIATDLVITLYVIKAANSAAFSSGTPVGNLREAIPRLGYRMLYSIVIDISLTKLFHAKSQLINQKLEELWEHSRKLAASSYVLAQRRGHLKPEDAMLAGLVHDIGSLPLYLYVDRHYPRTSPEVLDDLVKTFAAQVGTKLLESWNFPEEIINTITGNEDLRQPPLPGVADYGDVVTVADLITQPASHLDTWINSLAAEALGCYSGDCRDYISSHAEQFAKVNDTLGIEAEKAP